MTTADPAEDARSQAVALVPTYLRTIDDLYLDPSRPLDDIYEVAVDSEATAQAPRSGCSGRRDTGRSGGRSW